MVTFLAILTALPVLAQATALPAVSVMLGQKNVYTEFNYHEAYFEESFDNTDAPLPGEREAYAEGNVAQVSLQGIPGEAGEAFAGLGILFEIDFGEYSQDEVLNWPVKVSFDFSYQLSAYWEEGHGAANAEIEIPHFHFKSYDMIGIATGTQGKLTDAVELTFTAKPDGTPLILEDFLYGTPAEDAIISLGIHCHVHASEEAGLVHSSAAGVTLNSITIDLVAPPSTTTTTVIDNTSTTTTIGNTASTTTIPGDMAAHFLGHPTKGNAPLEVHFIDTSSGVITDWLWDFGDGSTSRERNPRHTYTVPAEYNVALTVSGPDDEATALRNGYILVTEAGVEADFTAEPNEGAPPLAVQFVDASRGEITDWLWEFGDGSTSTEQHPRHTYEKSGTYSVTLTAAQNGAADTKTIVDYILVTKAGVEADFTAEPLRGTAPLDVQFTDMSQGTVTQWLWKFGDGATSIAQHPMHTYEIPGTYTVGLAVEGSSGLQSVEIKEAHITVDPETASRFSLAGTVTGRVEGEVALFLTGDEKRVLFTKPDESYEFKGLKPGSYIVTPLKEGVGFDPVSSHITVTDHSVENVDFTARLSGPSFLSLQVDPNQVPADGQSPVLFIVHVEHPLGSEHIAAVTLDLKPIGGNAGQELSDDAANGDEVAGDGVYSYRTVVADSTPPGPKGIFVKVADTTGAGAFDVIELHVTKEITDTVGMNAVQQKTVQNEVEGQTLVTQYALADESLRTGCRAASDSAVVLQVFDPDDEPYFDSPIPVTSKYSEIQVSNAAQGTWTYQIENKGSQSKQYSLSVSTAGTGVISGKTVDAQTGDGIDGISIRTSGGGAAVTEDGYYVLVHPAGMFTIQASGQDYSAVTNSVTLNAGETEEVNMVMSAVVSDNESDDTDNGEDNETCVLASVLCEAGDTGKLNLLRRFRDGVLSKTLFGRHCISLYYTCSPKVLLVVKQDPVLQRKLVDCINKVLPIVRSIVAGQSARVDAKLRNHIVVCLEGIALKAGPRLKKEIEQFISDLEGNPILSSFFDVYR